MACCCPSLCAKIMKPAQAARIYSETDTFGIEKVIKFEALRHCGKKKLNNVRWWSILAAWTVPEHPANSCMASLGSEKNGTDFKASHWVAWIKFHVRFTFVSRWFHVRFTFVSRSSFSVFHGNLWRKKGRALRFEACCSRLMSSFTSINFPSSEVLVSSPDFQSFAVWNQA